MSNDLNLSRLILHTELHNNVNKNTHEKVPIVNMRCGLKKSVTRNHCSGSLVMLNGAVRDAEER